MAVAMLGTDRLMLDGLNDLPQSVNVGELLFQREPYDEFVWEES